MHWRGTGHRCWLSRMSRNQHPHPLGFRRLPRVADSMTPEMVSFFDLGQAAEWSGDLEAAHDYHRGIPAFDRGRHRAILRQVSEYADSFTPWLWARWAVYQASRCEAPSTYAGRLQRAVVQEALDLFHCDALDDDFQHGGDPVRTVAHVAGESWAFRQLCVEGAVTTFVDELAGGLLREAADLVRSWVEAPVQGFQLAPRQAGLRVRDLATGEQFEPLDLGAGCGEGREDGTFLLGRLVPTGIDDQLMFDTRPLAVDQRTATDTARAADDDGWIDALVLALEEGRMCEAQLCSEDLGLASDVPELSLVEFGTPPRDLARVMEQLRSGRDEVSRAAFRILRQASERPADLAVAPYVAASVCIPEAFAQARRMIVTAGQKGWDEWAALATGPARARLLELDGLTRLPSGGV